MTVNRKKMFIIIALCFSLILMGAGYALLSSTLKIDGTNTMAGKWDIKIKSITPTVTGIGEAEFIEIQPDGLTASLGINLYQDGDSVEYTVVVENLGNIPAKLSGFDFYDGADNEYINVTNNIDVNQKLAANSTNTFTIKFELVNPADEEIPEIQDNYYSFYFEYIQDTGV